ncbi:MAG: hypothetical protein ACRDZX_08830 [Acidimicrobiales bacterium]
MATTSPPARDRFEDRLLDAFLDRFEEIRGEGGAPAGALPARGRRRGPVALTSLAVLAAAALGVAFALSSAPSPTGTAPGLRWALAGYVGSPWEGTVGRGLSVSGPSHQALTCPSTTTCYVEGPAGAGQGAEVEATYDGGKTWHLTGLGGARALSNVSCPSAQVCALLEGRTDNKPLFVETTDGGRTWLERPAPNWLSPLARDGASGSAPTETLTAMSCRSRSSCSVLVWIGELRDGKLSGRGVASLTSDGGRAWSSPVPAPKPSWELQCSADGRCLAAGPSGAAYSTDNGLRWSVPSGLPSGAASYFSCATEAMCTAWSAPAGGAESLLVSGDGGESWSALSATGLPTGVLFTTLACPTSSDCWLSGDSAQALVSGNDGVVLSSANGGRAWGTSLLPRGTGAVFALSCPGQGTCFLLATKQPPASSPGAPPALVLLAHFAKADHGAAP